MIGLKFKRLDGTYTQVDMGKLQSLADGVSQIHHAWASTLVYCKELDAVIELSEAPPDIRGNSEGAAEEVDAAYAASVYGVRRP
ncbi:hypothetical protein D3879_01525 [Pseudomonas cavernicola]|uniref:Uncharacterized protein n=1 Tax=Pseudomonas cavernicola TaxID=2320866 RepID=A0A418XHT9_9PSED|nr:hypothetical protein [Pseudomonas cavernicola]RJG12034.1 hypothetical protein D3879_01525 [Pseudomonas cavernicola]